MTIKMSRHGDCVKSKNSNDGQRESQRLDTCSFCPDFHYVILLVFVGPVRTLWCGQLLYGILLSPSFFIFIFDVPKYVFYFCN